MLYPSTMSLWSSSSCLANIQDSAALFGSEATCKCYESDRLCRIKLAANSTLTVNANVTLTTESQPVTVSAPEEGFTVSLKVSAPSNVSVCTPSFELDGSGSSLPGSSKVNPSSYSWQLSNGLSTWTEQGESIQVSNASYSSAGTLNYVMRAENEALNINETVEGSIRVHTGTRSCGRQYDLI